MSVCPVIDHVGDCPDIGCDNRKLVPHRLDEDDSEAGETIILGGLIVAINFHLLNHTLKKMFQPDVVKERGHSVVGNVLVKYYIRFAVSGAIIFLLISKHIVHPLGLLAGLSVVLASTFMATVLELSRLLFKEAV